ncbi:ROK family transcriptional regulator [Cellulomonas soli]|uniref:ROK family transcriptional regulator n=1 Tax=Cellulomonas soli TaxID=931535 RepID=UPI003F8637C8
MTTPTGSGPAHASSRAAILDVIRAAGTISRVHLARTAGLSAPTVSTVVRRLIDDGLVVEVGHGRSTGGKPPTLLQLDPRARYAVGVHLDHAGLSCVISDLGGTIVDRWQQPGAGSDDPQDVVHRIAGDVATHLTAAALGTDRVLGIGVASPGPLARPTGMTLTPPAMHRWTEFPLATRLAEASGMPVVLDNDATAAAVGEYWCGGIDTSTAFAALYMGTGIGAGIVLDGAVLRGASSNAGEVGHICVDVDGPPCWCGGRGCVEALAGPAAVVAAAHRAGLDLPGRSVAEDFATVARAATAQDPVAVGLLRDSARYVAVAAQTLANVLDLEAVVLTGPSFALAGAHYLPVVEELLARTFFARETHPTRVAVSANAPDAAAIGAAALVLQSELSPRRPGLRMALDDHAVDAPAP